MTAGNKLLTAMFWKNPAIGGAMHIKRTTTAKLGYLDVKLYKVSGLLRPF